MRSFIRCLFGNNEDYKNNEILLNNRKKLDNTINNSLKNPFLKISDFVVYVLGEDNYKYLNDKGVNCLLVNKQSSLFTLKKNWHNKIECLKAAMCDYDEIVYLDWDCQPIKAIPSDLWEKLAQKEVIQANLMKYRDVHIGHRKENTNLLPNGGFIYIRDKTIPEKLTKLNPPSSAWDDEAYYSYYMDEINGGWKGIEDYYKKFEPEICNQWHGVFNGRKKNIIFKHSQKTQVKEEDAHD